MLRDTSCFLIRAGKGDRHDNAEATSSSTIEWFLCIPLSGFQKWALYSSLQLDSHCYQLWRFSGRTRGLVPFYPTHGQEASPVGRYPSVERIKLDYHFNEFCSIVRKVSRDLIKICVNLRSEYVTSPATQLPVRFTTTCSSLKNNRVLGYPTITLWSLLRVGSQIENKRARWARKISPASRSIDATRSIEARAIPRYAQSIQRLTFSRVETSDPARCSQSPLRFLLLLPWALYEVAPEFSRLQRVVSFSRLLSIYVHCIYNQG